MNFNSIQIPPPKYWQEFEDLCLAVFKRVWSDPTATKNGRSGQQQHGTDISGKPRDSKGIHGVQCKDKDTILGSEVTRAEFDAEIAKAVPGNIQSVKADLPYVDLTTIQTYAIDHPRAARYLASIRSQKLAKGVDKAYLKKLCKSTKVVVHDTGGKLEVDPASIMDFLGVLDSSLYQVELIKDSPESFRASSRSPIT